MSRDSCAKPKLLLSVQAPELWGKKKLYKRVSALRSELMLRHLPRNVESSEAVGEPRTVLHQTTPYSPFIQDTLPQRAS